MSTPGNIHALKKRLPALRAWLVERGASLIDNTNEWEVIRFKTARSTAVIYRKAIGVLTYTGGAKAAVDSFTKNGDWRAGPATKRAKPRGGRNPVFATLRRRDGDLCFFCRNPVQQDGESIEHLVAVTHQGPNHISNFVLAHRRCNANAGHLSAMEKIAIHVAAEIAKHKGETA
jgi:hypothetical protein